MKDAPGEGVILFGGSGFLGHYILENYPNVISVGRSAPRTANRHIQIDNMADLDALGGVPFDKFIFILGNSDRENMEKEHLLPGEPTPFDYHVIPLIQVLEQLKQYPLKKFIHFSTISGVADRAKNILRPRQMECEIKDLNGHRGGQIVA